jgi:alpha-D-xyloside xylohydrolase
MKNNCFLSGIFAVLVICLRAAAQPAGSVMNDAVDVSDDFKKLESTCFMADRLAGFDAATGAGTLVWNRCHRTVEYSFEQMNRGFVRVKTGDFPASQYDENPALPFQISFVSPRTVRLRIATRDFPLRDEPSLMLVDDVPKDRSWKVDPGGESVTYTGEFGSVKVSKNPWHVAIFDRSGKLLTKTMRLGERTSFSQPQPFSFVRRASDFGHSLAATFQLSHDEKIFGCGESFTRFDKRGQKIIAYARDGMGVQTEKTYKPVPFFMSSAGYGMFVHTSTPVTFDFGRDFDEFNTIYSGDETLDLFIFLGNPKEILSEYTALTGRSPVPPLWSFGLWMSRITYKSEAEMRDVATRLRQYKIPCDVIHIDTGWFETDWECDYKFSTNRFPAPAKMLSDLKQQGFRVSLWQLPYYSGKNVMFKEAVSRGYAVRGENGRFPAGDAVLDFSNPAAAKWYQGLVANLLKQGVSAIKADFGEGAPLHGLYASGRTGYYEHNLFPLRYQKTVADITKQITGDNIIWARSAWAGSQRYPLHWGGDAENSDSAMAAELRGGLSFGLSGFTYWSHDVGGFVNRAPRDLYGRWLAFGVLTSHTRCHGSPPREPWAYDDAFVDDFRRAVELKYSLMPYVYAQAKDSSAHGWPMLRALFVEFPDDPTSWMVDDEYFFGSDLLVAPMFESHDRRKVYLPPGNWIDYQTGGIYPGAQWHQLAAGRIPVVLLVRDHSVIPIAKVAQSTSEIDWENIELRVFSSDQSGATGRFALPRGNLQTLQVAAAANGFALGDDPLPGRVKWRITCFGR